MRLEWISAAEGERVKSVINDMTKQLQTLGPLDLPGKFTDWDAEVIALAREAQAKGAAEAEMEATHV